MIDYIECSIALIKNNTDYLFSRRTKKPFHNHYEFPGGKIENRETPEEALARECYEELDIEIIENIYHGSITHRYDKLSVRLHIFEIIKYIGKIKPNEKQELKYINPATSNLLFLESTSRVLNRLKLRELFFITPRNINPGSVPRTYQVKSGDTLSKISEKFYGTESRWNDIYQANRERLTNAGALSVSQEIIIP